MRALLMFLCYFARAGRIRPSQAIQGTSLVPHCVLKLDPIQRRSASLADIVSGVPESPP